MKSHNQFLLQTRLSLQRTSVFLSNQLCLQHDNAHNWAKSSTRVWRAVEGLGMQRKIPGEVRAESVGTTWVGGEGDRMTERTRCPVQKTSGWPDGHEAACGCKQTVPHKRHGDSSGRLVASSCSQEYVETFKSQLLSILPPSPAGSSLPAPPRALSVTQIRVGPERTKNYAFHI